MAVQPSASCSLHSCRYPICNDHLHDDDDDDDVLGYDDNLDDSDHTHDDYGKDDGHENNPCFNFSLGEKRVHVKGVVSGSDKD